MHMWDLIAAWRAWNFTATFFGQLPYAPTAGDEAYGRATRATWYALMAEPSAAPPGLLPVDAAPGWPAHYTVFVQGNGTMSPGAGANVVDHKADRCALWASLLAPDPRGYWWCN